MTVNKLCVLAGLAIAVPVAALAQSSGSADDIAYCQKLASRYMAQHPAFEGLTAEKGAAMARCKKHTTQSIATLELALKDARMELPTRATTTAAMHR
jgi:hypothetical protein